MIFTIVLNKSLHLHKKNVTYGLCNAYYILQQIFIQLNINLILIINYQ